VTSTLEPIEDHVRAGEVLDRDGQYVIRGWPLTTVGLLANAKATASRYSYRAEPFLAASVEMTMPGWDAERILSGRRMRTRRSYAMVPASSVLGAGFELLPTFDAPHYSIVMGPYTEDEAQRLLRALGDLLANPYCITNQR
jgi:hypothetical protein